MTLEDYQESVESTTMQPKCGIHTFLGPWKPSGGSITGALCLMQSTKLQVLTGFKEAFVKVSAVGFGSDWTWLVKKPTVQWTSSTQNLPFALTSRQSAADG
jgi:superoxide dismutase